MNAKLVWFGALIVVVVAAAAWLLRDSASSARSAPAADRSATAHLEPLAPTARTPQESRAARPEPHRNGNGNGSGSATAAKPAQSTPRPDPREREFLARLFAPPGPAATDPERQFWDESPIQDLLYPAGHPCAGQPLDSTSPDALVEAGVQAMHLESVPDADVPQCVYQGNWPFHPLNQTCSSVNPKDPDSVARCTNYLLSAPQDPQAYPATIWLPCADSSQATTRRAYLESLIRDQVDRIFAGPRCTAG